MPFGNKKKGDNIFDLAGMGMGNTSNNLGKEIKSGVPEAEKEFEVISFVKKSGKKDRADDDPFAQIGL